MTDTEILEVVLREMCSYGAGWRLDWSEFDGRTLKAQLEGINVWAREARNNADISEYKNGTNFLSAQEDEPLYL